MKKLYFIFILIYISSNSSAQILSDSLSNWMKYINDDVKLMELTVPGTHDSGATSGTSFAECQTATIIQQLNSGIRFLDIRLRPDNDKLEVCHGSVGMNTYFEEDVMNHCKNFLDENPAEIIFMSIHKDDGESSDY